MKHPYKVITVDGTQVLEHRYVWEQVHGPIPKGYEIHHINGKYYDNRIENLQMLTISEHRKLHSMARANGCDIVDTSSQIVQDIREYHRNYYKRNAETIKSKMRAYRKEHAEQQRAHDVDRRKYSHESHVESDAKSYRKHAVAKREAQVRYNAEHVLQRRQYRERTADAIKAYSAATRPISSARKAYHDAIVANAPEKIERAYSRIVDAKALYYLSISDTSEKASSTEALAVFMRKSRK